ncbi:MAG: RluA family pseudouridine synthase [Candidatus Marinimicrobia bacterium]|nr:RluA family pseudouridine synthase [Candidatus Neomarinimicrobiota bacterium]
MSDVSDRLLTFSVEMESDMRLDIYLSDRIKTLSRSKISNLIRAGFVKVNRATVKSGYSLRTGDEISVVLPSPEPREIPPENIPIRILYEDEYFIAIDKAPGMVVHPGAGVLLGTLTGALRNYTSQLSLVNGPMKPGLVHRLDKDTSGVIIAAKTDEAHWKIARLFAERQIYKEYRALVWGTPEPNIGLIDAPIGRSQNNRKKFTVTQSGRNARTRYEVLQDFDIMSFLKVILETGRTHQIRVHFAHVGHPVVGDPTYGGGIKYLLRNTKAENDLGNRVMTLIRRQMLHAHRIRFVHPLIDKEIEIVAPIPEDFLAVEKMLVVK